MCTHTQNTHTPTRTSHDHTEYPHVHTQTQACTKACTHLKDSFHFHQLCLLLCLHGQFLSQVILQFSFASLHPFKGGGEVPLFHPLGLAQGPPQERAVELLKVFHRHRGALGRRVGRVYDVWVCCGCHVWVWCGCEAVDPISHYLKMYVRMYMHFSSKYAKCISKVTHVCTYVHTYIPMYIKCSHVQYFQPAYQGSLVASTCLTEGTPLHVHITAVYEHKLTRVCTIYVCTYIRTCICICTVHTTISTQTTYTHMFT